MVSFDAVADEYDHARPGYPDGVFDALGDLSGARVLEGGAGTGIATIGLVERGAWVVPFDIGPAVLQRANRRLPGLTAVVADGARLPFRDSCADWLCFAQSWHWLDEQRRCQEAARVLASGGRWAGWWSHARADGEAWFDAYWGVIEAACPNTRRSQRDTDWGEGVRRSGLFAVAERVTVSWTRKIPVTGWLIDLRSHSYVAALTDKDREQFLARVEQLLLDQFGTHTMLVPYETWLWTANKT